MKEGRKEGRKEEIVLIHIVNVSEEMLLLLFVDKS
jgi:hypothetical protein